MNQIFLFLYLAIYLGKENGNQKAMELYNKLPQIHTLLQKTIDTCTQKAEQIANSLVEKATDLYCLGYGVNFGTALEGSLKIKEVYYKHCEGMYSSEFKHGPLSIIEPGYPILFPASPDDSGMVISHVNEIMVRKGNVVVISPFHDAYEKNASQLVIVPDCDHYFTPFLNTTVLQLIAYFASIHSGYDPDFPRNISKTLTVD
jgi:glucosamine--fructose-6-phosphate aminotransferase (isomerizing)